MQDPKIESLASTLKMNGLASSVTDALRMAATIIGTEQKVSSEFNRYAEPPAKKKMTYQEEIDDLIRKTSPEYKNYHIPVKGYKREDKPEREVFYELEEPSSGSQKLLLKTELKTEESIKTEKPVVFTDVFESSQKPLNEIMNVVDHGDVCANEITTAPQVLEEEETQKADEFIVSDDKLPENKPDSVQLLQEKKEVAVPIVAEKKEELFKEIKEDHSKPHEVKNPIQSVDLMSYFKAG